MSSHFLLYRNDGTIFDLPVQSGPTFGNTAQLGKWDNNWTHIRPFGLSGQPYFLLYKQSSGEAFTMPIHTGEEYGVATPCGKWETGLLSPDPLRTLIWRSRSVGHVGKRLGAK